MSILQLTFNTNLTVSSPEHMIEAWNRASDSDADELMLDFSRVNYIRPFAAALIYGIAHPWTQHDRSASYIEPRKESARHQLEYLWKHHIEGDRPDSFKGPGFPVFTLNKPISLVANRLVRLIGDQVGDRWHPSVRKLTHLAFKESIDNSFNHAPEAKYRAVSANVITSRIKIRICILDSGLGIPAHLRFRRKYSQIESDCELLKLSVQKGVTGTVETKRGWGLYILSQLVKANEGELTIVFGRGLLSVSADGEKCKTLKNELHGTAINVELIRNKEFNFNIDELLDEAEMIF